MLDTATTLETIIPSPDELIYANLNKEQQRKVLMQLQHDQDRYMRFAAQDELSGKKMDVQLWLRKLAECRNALAIIGRYFPDDNLEGAIL